MDMLPLAPGFVYCQFPCNFRAVNGATLWTPSPETMRHRGLMANGPHCERQLNRCRAGRHALVRALHYVAARPAYVTSSVMTLKLARVQGPKEVTIATSVASRPRAIKMRPTRGVLWRASNVNQRPR